MLPGSDLVLGTADGIVQVTRLHHVFETGSAGGIGARLKSAGVLASLNRPALGGDGAQMIFTRRAHPEGSIITEVEPATSAKGGLVVVSLSGASVVVTRVASKESKSIEARVPGTTAIAAVFAPTLFVAGVSGDTIWAWDVEHGGTPVSTLVRGTSRVIAWIEGVSPATLLLGRAGAPAERYRYDGGLVSLDTVELGDVAAMLNVPGQDGPRLGVGDAAGGFRLCRIDVTSGQLVPQRPLTTELKRLTGLAATRGLFAAVGDDALALWEIDGVGHAAIPLEDRPSRVVLLRARSGSPAAAWIDRSGDAKVAGVDLARAEDPGRSLSLAGDGPSGPGGVDVLDFETYVRPMSILISNRQTATPLVMAIDGAWGTGKTSLGLMVDAELVAA
ncbi:MAG: KAP family NTPase, partial [Actinobacteria bacterium]|nr:KAP family NTPase [Actinomycetota bacterium]